MLNKVLTWNPRLFTLFGVPVTCHVSLMVFLLVMLVMSPMTFPLLLITFISIIPHEYGHILAARHYGIGCQKVIMTPMGGVALLNGMPKEWQKEFWITLWGPLVSLGLAFMFLPLGFLTFQWTNLFLGASVVNAALFLFNMLPMFPMDGGRLFRSLLSAFLPHRKSTVIAVRTSQVLASLIGILALVNMLWMLAFTMVFVVMLGQKELERPAQKKMPKEVFEDTPEGEEVRRKLGIRRVEPEELKEDPPKRRVITKMDGKGFHVE